MNNMVKKLKDQLNEASKAYYAGNPIMSDHEWDRLFDKLKALESETNEVVPDSPTQKAGAEIVNELPTAKHEQPALSLDKIKYADREDLKKWLGDKSGVISWKMDGSTVVLNYDNGTLTSAVTRGDGETGSVITHNAKYFKGIPEKIGYTGHLVVRGEALMSYEEFERVNAEAGGEYENPRNLATATIQMLDANESKKREIQFKAFELVTPEPQAAFDETGSFNLTFMGDRLNWLETLGFDIVEKGYTDATDILEKVDEWQADVPNLKFPTDGLVISYNDMAYGMSLGATRHHFRHSIALKWTDETKETTIRDIEWSVSKTGVITPVAIFDPVRLGAGSTITRASLHNISIMQNMPDIDGGDKRRVCGKGSRAKIYLANMIIPQCACCSDPDWTLYGYHNGPSDCEDCRECLAHCSEGHVSAPCDTDEGCPCGEPNLPEVCPICGADTEIHENNGVKTLHCPNHDGCPAQQIGKLMNTFSKDGLFVKGLGESQIEDLIAYGVVDTTPLSFYRATTAFSNGKEFSDRVVKLLEKDGWGKKKWENLVDAINASRDTTLQKFLYSLNISLLGNDLSKKLSKFWHNDIEEFISFTSEIAAQSGKDDRSVIKKAMDTLTEIEGVGEEKARNIVWWAYNLPDNDGLKDLLALREELNFPEVKDSTPADNSLEGLTFVITGAVYDYKNRDEFKASVEARGGKVSGSVSKKTNYLISNENSESTKSKKAADLGISVLTEAEFIEKFGR